MKLCTKLLFTEKIKENVTKTCKFRKFHENIFMFYAKRKCYRIEDNFQKNIKGK